MRYQEELIEEIREKNDIVDVISSYVSLKKKGNSYFGLCPFHGEKTPSFHVSPDRQMYYCFGCGQGGNVYTFLMEYNRMTFTEALKELGKRAGVEVPERSMSPEEQKEADDRDVLLAMNKDAAVYFHYLLKSKRGANAMAYLKERGLSDEMIRHFGLGYADIYRDDLYQYLKGKGYTDLQMKESSLVTIDTAKGSYDQFFNRVMFPIMDARQRVIGFGGRVMGEGQPKYLNSRETVLFDKGRNLYGLGYARRSREPGIILCEGYMDVIALHQAGLTNAVAPLGTAFTPSQALMLRRYTDEVILSFDSDGAGIKAARRALPILREAGLSAKVLSMKPFKDPDELIRQEGVQGYRRRLEEAKVGRMFELDVLYDEFDQKDPDGRTQFVHAAARELAQIEEPIERENYVTAASNRFMIKKKDLASLVDRYGMEYELKKAGEENRRPVQTEETRRRKKEDARKQPQILLLSWICDSPALYDALRPYLSADDFLDPVCHAVAMIVFEKLDSGQELKPAQIIDRFTDVEKQQEAAAIFHGHLPQEEESWKKAVTDVTRKVLMASVEEEMSRTSEIERWQDLLKRRKEIQKFTIE